ncbi:DUF1343 domain-containing protein [bacterium]|nr:DUF1343 domain-containing protein [bacterium]
MKRTGLCLLVCSALVAQTGKIQLGVDVLLSEQSDLLQGKRVGLITNQTGLTSSHVSTVDALFAVSKVTALFGPEHGVRGDEAGGRSIPGSVDAKTGVPVYSLYGKTHKPTAAMLSKVDVLVYDIQDIGSRAYTYIYTMALGMEAARERGIPFIVLDRPNPLGGERVEGPVLDPAFKSFVGLYPIPYLYGMTVGELALYFNYECGIEAQLIVVPMKGWRRSMVFSDTGILWVPTSPHIPHAQTPFYCAAVGCIGELGTLSEGVGWPAPFELIGAPWMDGRRLADELNNRNLPGVFFRPVQYRPFYHSFKEQPVQGVQLHILDVREFQPMFTQLHLLDAVHRLFPENDFFATDRINSFDRAMGTDQVRVQIKQGKSPNEIIASWQQDLVIYKQKRERFLLYH